MGGFFDSFRSGGIARGDVEILTDSITRPTLTLTGVASQTAYMELVQNSSLTRLVSIDPQGNVYIRGNLNVDGTGSVVGNVTIDGNLTVTGTFSSTSTDHGGLTGLLDDDHTQYARLDGRSGGQVLYGGVSSGETLTLGSTIHATRGDIIIDNGRFPMVFQHGSSTSYGRLAQFLPDVMYLSSNIYYDGTNFRVDDTTNVGWLLFLDSSASNTPFRIVRSPFLEDPVQITDDGHTALSITHAGLVGINTNTPTHQVHIVHRVGSSAVVALDQQGVNGRMYRFQSTSAGAFILDDFDDGENRMVINSNGDFTFAQSVATTGSPTALTWTSGAHTTLAASTEATSVNFNLSATVQFATGALATQRAFRIQAPTYRFVGASTITDAATLYIDNAPIQGTNATITNSYAIFSAAGLNRFDGNGTNVFELPADATDPTGGGGAAIGRISVRIGGVTRYLAYY